MFKLLKKTGLNADTITHYAYQFAQEYNREYGSAGFAKSFLPENQLTLILVDKALNSIPNCSESDAYEIAISTAKVLETMGINPVAVKTGAVSLDKKVLALMDAAKVYLTKLRSLSEEGFARGEDKPEHERLHEALTDMDDAERTSQDETPVSNLRYAVDTLMYRVDTLHARYSIARDLDATAGSLKDHYLDSRINTLEKALDAVKPRDIGRLFFASKTAMDSVNEELNKPISALDPQRDIGGQGTGEESPANAMATRIDEPDKQYNHPFGLGMNTEPESVRYASLLRDEIATLQKNAALWTADDLDHMSALQFELHVFAKAESQKRTHEEVRYESPSRHKGQTCAGCKWFIAPNACTGVQKPIRAGDWCTEYDATKKASFVPVSALLKSAERGQLKFHDQPDMLPSRDDMKSHIDKTQLDPDLKQDAKQRKNPATERTHVPVPPQAKIEGTPPTSAAPLNQDLMYRSRFAKKDPVPKDPVMNLIDVTKKYIAKLRSLSGEEFQHGGERLERDELYIALQQPRLRRMGPAIRTLVDTIESILYHTNALTTDEFGAGRAQPEIDAMQKALDAVKPRDIGRLFFASKTATDPDEYWVELVNDQEDKAKAEFMQSPEVQQIAQDNGWTLEEAWEHMGTDFANEFFNPANRFFASTRV